MFDGQIPTIKDIDVASKNIHRPFAGFFTIMRKKLIGLSMHEKQLRPSTI